MAALFLFLSGSLQSQPAEYRRILWRNEGGAFDVGIWMDATGSVTSETVFFVYVRNVSGIGLDGPYYRLPTSPILVSLKYTSSKGEVTLVQPKRNWKFPENVRLKDLPQISWSHTFEGGLSFFTNIPNNILAFPLGKFYDISRASPAANGSSEDLSIRPGN